MSTTALASRPDMSVEAKNTKPSQGCPHSRPASSQCVEMYGFGVRLAIAMELGLTSFHAECSVCGNSSVPVCCTECDYIGCPNHTTHEHALGTCLCGQSEGVLWCFHCQDIVLDPKFEAKRISEIEAALQQHSVAPKSHNKLEKSQVDVPFHAFLGIRGFVNLGATCYVSVVLQSLIHNPLVRAFFLAGGHDNQLCERESCIECSIDRIYTNFFASSSVSGYGITDLLVSLARKQPNMGAGSTEQDAHEFYLFLLSEFHSSHNSEETFGSKNDNSNEHCGCVTHRNFAGSLESTLSCECGYRNRKLDPLVDLSLDLEQSRSTTLDECLRRFTSGEHVANYRCEQCHQIDTVTKRILISQFPPVLIIQLKRFKHFRIGSTKVDTIVEFPLEIDLAPYTSTYTEGDASLVYELYGVICHTGSLDTGHYTCLMKHSSGQWFHFDDVTVVPVDIDFVKKSTAYLLFYIVKWAI